MPDLIAALHERFGLNALVQGEHEKALRWFRRMEAREPDSIRVLRNIGVCLLAAGDASGARGYLLREEALYGPSFLRHSALADLAYALGEREEAAARYRSALADPEAAPGGRYHESRPLLEARARICADPAAFGSSRAAAGRFDAGQEAAKAGRQAEALALFEEAAELDPTHWPALNNAGGIALNALGDPERALAFFERALSLAHSPQAAHNADLARKALAARLAAAKPGKRAKAVR